MGDTKNQKQLREQLNVYNDKIDQLIKERAAFLDDNMHVFAEFQIGDDVYNVKTGEKTKVRKHYRYWSEQNIIYDTSFSVECRFENGDNTSRYGGMHPFILLKEYESKSEKYIFKVESYVRFSR